MRSRQFFRDLLRDIPCMHPQEDIDREQDAIGIDLAVVLEDPDCRSDVDLEDHDAPPFAKIPISQPGKEKVEETGNKGIFPEPRAPAQTPGKEHGGDSALLRGEHRFPPYLTIFIAKRPDKRGTRITAPGCAQCTGCFPSQVCIRIGKKADEGGDCRITESGKPFPVLQGGIVPGAFIIGCREVSDC